MTFHIIQKTEAGRFLWVSRVPFKVSSCLKAVFAATVLVWGFRLWVSGKHLETFFIAKDALERKVG